MRFLEWCVNAQASAPEILLINTGRIYAKIDNGVACDFCICVYINHLLKMYKL